ncbi:hypothetical protein ACPCSQ_01065 [Streptomyces griseoincarnatus]
MYLSGDTVMFDGLRDIARRCPGIRLAVLHLGGTTLPPAASSSPWTPGRAPTSST